MLGFGPTNSSSEAVLPNEEFSYFIQCLGAKSMTIKVMKGSESFLNTTDFSSQKNIFVHIISTKFLILMKGLYLNMINIIMQKFNDTRLSFRH